MFGKITRSLMTSIPILIFLNSAVRLPFCVDHSSLSIVVGIFFVSVSLLMPLEFSGVLFFVLSQESFFALWIFEMDFFQPLFSAFVSMRRTQL